MDKQDKTSLPPWAIDDRSFEQGMEEAWSIAKRITNMSGSDLSYIFNCRYVDDVFTKYKPKEAAKILAIIDELEELKGDIENGQY